MLFIECTYPWKYVAFIQGFTTIVAVLFLNFYIKTYKQTKHITKSTSNGTVNGQTGNVDVTNGNYIGPETNGFKQSHDHLHHRKHVNKHI